jgi:hypothetical protein
LTDRRWPATKLTDKEIAVYAKKALLAAVAEIPDHIDDDDSKRVLGRMCIAAICMMMNQDDQPETSQHIGSSTPQQLAT